MGPDPNLISQATEFRDRVADLVNRTVANGAHLPVLFDARSGECRIAPGISRARLRSVPIPLAFDSSQPTCYLDLSHRLELDDEGKWLTDARSRYAVYRGADASRPLFRYDYMRVNDPHPEVHLHITGVFTHGVPTGVRPLEKLHLPLGSRRFRLTLEDVIQFLVLEGFAKGRPGWEDVIAEHRSEWYEKQVKAAVRRFPEAAADTLRDMGRI